MIIKIVVAGVPGVALQENTAFIRKRSQVVGNVLAVVLEIKKIVIVLAGVSDVALHTDLDEILHT